MVRSWGQCEGSFSNALRSCCSFLQNFGCFHTTPASSPRLWYSGWFSPLTACYLFHIFYQLLQRAHPSQIQCRTHSHVLTYASILRLRLVFQWCHYVARRLLIRHMTWLTRCICTMTSQKHGTRRLPSKSTSRLKLLSRSWLWLRSTILHPQSQSAIRLRRI